jgi:hypothetical protein
MLAAYHCNTFNLQMVTDDTAAMKILEEDRQEEAILKEFTNRTPVPRIQDSAPNQLAMNTMMSPGRRVARALVVKGTKKACSTSKEETESS